MSGRAIDPLQVARRVAEQAFAMIPGAEGALLGLLADSSCLQYVCGTGTLNGFVGERLTLEEMRIYYLGMESWSQMVYDRLAEGVGA